MASPRKRQPRSEEFKPPLDVREWVDPWLLATWTEEQVAQFDQTTPGADRALPRGPEDRFRMMARLLVFAYASRVFNSEEIVRKCFSEPVFRVLCDGEPPIARDLWCFRRNNRRSLELLLSRVLLRGVRERFDLDATVPQPDLEEDCLHRASERLNIARHMDQP